MKNKQDIETGLIENKIKQQILEVLHNSFIPFMENVLKEHEEATKYIKDHSDDI